ncbi:MAG: hypothetical protein JSW41_05995 [Candidatus Aenigmatarchaeota archaeon]|nr:MAG: hypothetical protein JSW41_05995 [Candidatus Aenigmarchaeota archaeon]
MRKRKAMAEMKKFTVLVLLVVLMFLGSFFAKADESENQVRIFSFADKHISGKLYLRLQFVLGDILRSTEPLVYFGSKIKFSEQFSLAIMGGKKYVKEGSDYKFVLSPTFDSKKWFICTQIDFNISNENIWQILQLRHYIGKKQDFWVGVESENIYGNRDDWYLSVGPCIGSRMGKLVSINTTFFRKWIHGKSFNVIRFYLILNLS